MSALLHVLLWLIIGVSAGVAWTFVCVFPLWGLLKLVEASGRRRNLPAERRHRHAVIALSTSLPALLAVLWLATVWVGDWLGLAHATAVQVGVLVGGGGMSAMLWIFVAASMSQTIRDP